MSCFEVEYNDFDILMMRYNNYSMKELTYYGSSKTDNMIPLLELSTELGAIEKNIINNYYNHYVESIMNNINNPNIYYVQKILFLFMNNICKMTVLFMSNKISTREYHFKLRHLIICIENCLKLIIEPIESNLEYILKSNNVFKLECSLLDFKKFIEKNKNKFSSKDKFEKINKVIELFEKNKKTY